MLGVTADDGRHVVFAAKIFLAVGVAQPPVPLGVWAERLYLAFQLIHVAELEVFTLVVNQAQVDVDAVGPNAFVVVEPLAPECSFFVTLGECEAVVRPAVGWDLAAIGALDPHEELAPGDRAFARAPRCRLL